MGVCRGSGSHSIRASLKRVLIGKCPVCPPPNIAKYDPPYTSTVRYKDRKRSVVSVWHFVKGMMTWAASALSAKSDEADPSPRIAPRVRNFEYANNIQPSVLPANQITSSTVKGCDSLPQAEEHRGERGLCRFRRSVYNHLRVFDDEKTGVFPPVKQCISTSE